MKKHKCYLCNSTEFEVIYNYKTPDKYSKKIADGISEKYYRELRVCKNCGHLFNVQNIKNIEKIYKDFWSTDLHGESAAEMYYRIASLPPHKSENFSRISWLKAQLEHISRAFGVLNKNPKKVLDVGCGLGVFLNGFLDDTWKGFGVEPSSHACKFIEEKLKYSIICDNYRSGLFREKFDLITLIHVLEHIKYPIEFLKDLKNDLCPKGIVFIESPEILELAHSSKEHEAFASEHYHIFSPGSLMVIMERAGFMPIVIEREMSSRPRRRIKAIGIAINEPNPERYNYTGSYKQVINLRNAYKRT